MVDGVTTAVPVLSTKHLLPAVAVAFDLR